MARGGARNRSGPAPDPLSERSERMKYTLTALPAEGYAGEVPEFPLPRVPGSDLGLRRAEIEIWRDAWASPQACAWSMEPWRHRIVAQYCRVAAIVERDPAASAALIGQLHRFRDQLGLTPAGMRDNGWRIASEPVKLEVVPEARPLQRRRSVSMAG